ncbi:IS30 family transposase [Tetragenococcus halophilus]|uniref:Integrase catalytic domain-containing protein n=1 Tax=Tetragenococcus halophilus (strain DSM 20338 / JCM 20259 / NCIMB 9735 / NBRC 12172) TaxID=945021 RepID=A0AAN1SEW9_TETHN|nr:IS30 family transposase [Tetragenococcus halophilus]BAK93507.1 hypothetical protein TEH_01800 [Tetragenococcus halophilus NBRC 12172]GBD70512.1 putative uncharacterized protein [Tetragenococcus halophilus subsp. halophilus]
MTQLEHSTESRKGKHLNYSERKDIEHWKQADQPLSNREIARRLGRAPQTIHTEIKDGTVRQIKRQTHQGKTYEYEQNVYFADAGQTAYDKARQNSGRTYQWIQAPEFMAYADYQMKVKKQAPDVVVGRAKLKNLFPEESIPCTTSLYHSIEQGFMNTINLDLQLKTRRKPKHSRTRKNRKIMGELIEKRPDVVNTRETFGHWEIDTVRGLRTGKDHCLLTLTERKTRYEVIIKVDGKDSEPVNRALQTLQEAAGQHFSRLFQTITADNGVEFAGLSALLQEISKVYFTHPYSSWERGTNENHNGLIRRFIPKGIRMSDVSTAVVRRVQDWMNHLPRKILGYATPYGRLLEEVSELV